MLHRNLSLSVLLLLIMLSSCQNGREVIGQSSFQKRKYTRGWYVERSGNPEKVGKAVVAEIPKEENSDINCAAPEVNKDAELKETVRLSENQFVPIPVKSSLDDNKSRDDNQSNDQSYSPEKKKRKKSKAAVIPIIDWGSFSGMLSTWFWGWEYIPFLNIPVLGIILGVIAIVLCFIGFFKLKKVKKKGRNILVGVFGIVFGLLSILVCIALL